MEWNRPRANCAEANKRLARLRMPTAWGIFVVMLVGCGIIGYKYWSFAKVGLSQTSQRSPSMIRDAGLGTKRALIPQQSTAVTNQKTMQQTSSLAQPENEYGRMFPSETIESVQTNKTGYIEIHGIKPDGTRTVHIVEPPPIFKHPTDEIILFALTSAEGKPVPPLPNLGGKRSDIAFMKSLNDPILSEASDTAQIRAYKDMVRSARKEIQERMENGESFSSIINDHVNLINDNTNLRASAQRELKEYIARGDIDGAKIYYKTINSHLNKMGISSIKLSQKNNFITKDSENE